VPGPPHRACAAQAAHPLYVGGQLGGVNLARLVERRFRARFLPKGTLAADFAATVHQMAAACGSAASPAELQRDLAQKRLGIQELEYIETLTREFEQAAARAQSRSRRRHIRVEREFEVRFRDHIEFATEYTRNISAGGLFIASDDPPPLDDVVDLRLEIPARREALEAQGRVVYVATEEEGSGAAAGFGVEFIDLPQEVQRELQRLVEEGRPAARAQGASVGAPAGESPRRVVIIGLRRESLLGLPSFLQRESIEIAEFPDVGVATDYLAVHPAALVVAGEDALGNDPLEGLTRLCSFLPRDTPRLVVQDSRRDLAALCADELCHGILDRTATLGDVLSEVQRRLGLRAREALRVPYRTAVEIALSAGRLTASTINISRGGLFLRSPEPLPADRSLSLVFDLPQLPSVSCGGIVVRCEPDRKGSAMLAGIKFVDIGEEAVTEIRRFVQASTNFREYFAWMKQRRFGA
jgi:type IV pilus assembly protein PilZ